ncbi:MAG: hypothetical protein JXA81_03460 [Sedimentisphaerales bacterium]|nr:hypothetical protein [Sedimentisphaerales bacterium]
MNHPESSRFIQTITIILVLVSFSSLAYCKVIYVDDDAVGANDGTSWENAYKYLQDALADADPAEKPIEIRVAQGIYKPDQGKNRTPGNRNHTFQLINGVTIKGSYAGLGETDPDARNVRHYHTILSGDLNSDDIDLFALNNPFGFLDEPTRAENSYSVVKAISNDKTTVLDGFTISGGNANDMADLWNPHHIGSGIYITKGEPVLINCTFTGNSAHFGGGIFNGGNPIITNCMLIRNAGWEGAGIRNHNSNPVITNCMFIGNIGYEGGGILNHGMSNPILKNCTFSGNSALFWAGAIYNHGSSSPILTNCILWNNFPEELYNSEDSEALVEYSNIRGGQSGEGNTDTDPDFINPGYWAYIDDLNISVKPNDPNAMWICGDYRLTPCSPCIDSGDPNYISEPNETDMDGNSRIIAGRIDMGAYEYPFVYDKPDEGTTPGSWRKYSENPVFSAGEYEQWDSRLNGSIAILKDNEEPVNKYKMWYVGGNQFVEGVGIGYATSSDGINWFRNENNPVLEPVEWWNTSGFSGICAIKDGSVYKLWYEGVDNQNTARIGYATSSDGINWDINNNPVFSPGYNDAWDNEDVGNPCVIKEGSTYKMWYWGDNKLADIDQIGLAVSDDGIKWQRAASNPVVAPDPSIWWQDGEGIGTPHVLRVNSGYVMTYHAADQIENIRIGLATSSDGLEWKKENEPILDLGDENSWESIGIITGSFIQDTRHLKLWYLGIDAFETIKVGLAISCDDIVFDIESEI